MTPRREFGAAIAACIAGAGLVLLTLRADWARVVYSAPSPLPSGSVSVSGQNLLPAAGGLALAALACLAAIIATRGLARRLAGLIMAGLGAWIAWVVSAPVHAATVIAAAAGQAASAEFAGGSLPGGNSAISGGTGTGGGLPAIGAASHVALAGLPWRSAAVAGAALVIVMGLVTAWRGPGWPVMSARFDRPAGAAAGPAVPERRGHAGPGPGAAAGPASPQGRASAENSADATEPSTRAEPPSAAGPAASAGSASVAGSAGGAVPAGAANPANAAMPPGAAESAESASAAEEGAEEGTAAYREDDTAALWEALDRGVDLTDAPG